VFFHSCADRDDFALPIEPQRLRLRQRYQFETQAIAGPQLRQQVQIDAGLTADDTVVVGSPPPLSDGRAVATKG